MTERPSLTGLTIALAEHRELDRLAEMIEQLGGVAHRCPFITIVDVEDPKPSLQWLNRLLEGQLDDVILLTGEGLSRLVQIAKNAGLSERTMEAFGAVRTICRGPKPVRALRAIGLRAGIVSDAPTTEGVMASLAREDLGGRRVGVQLYGEEPNDKLIAFLANAGATVHTVSPYTYQKGPPEPVLELISAMAEGRINVIAFTSSPQVHHLFEVAEARGRAADLRAGLARTRVAAVGPIVAATLGERGCKADIVPERSFFLRPMVNDIATFFANAASGNGAAA